MRRITFWILWLFVFSLPSEVVVSFKSVGTISRVIGLAAALAGILTILCDGRFRRPGAVLWLSFAFVMANTISLIWTTDHDATVVRVLTYAQLFGLVWLLWEFARLRTDQERLMLAYCIGALVAVAQILHNFGAGLASPKDFDSFQVNKFRYAPTGFDPNDCGLILALGIPMAWHLFLNARGAVRRVAMIAYVPAACIAILLTGSRGAFVAAVVALLIIPAALPRRRAFGSGLVIAAVFLVGTAAALAVVPAWSWNRMATAPQEIADGTMNGRKVIWLAAWEAFQERPLIGFGAGAFRSTIAHMPLTDGGRFPHSTAPHNTFLAVLVEQGVVGFAIFASLLAACAVLTWRMASADRKTAAVLMLTWLVGSLSLGWQYQKPTWLLFGLLAAQAGAWPARAERSRWDRAPATDHRYGAAVN